MTTETHINQPSCRRSPQWREIIETTIRYRQSKHPNVVYSADDIERLFLSWLKSHPRRFLESGRAYKNRQIDALMEYLKAAELAFEVR